jgi:hypothetical protein
MKKKGVFLVLLVSFILSCKGERPPSSSSSGVSSSPQASTLSQDLASPQVSSLSEASSSSPVSSQPGIDAPQRTSAGEALPGYRGYWEKTGNINIIDLIEFYPDQLPYLRNEIFARYGRPFVNKTYQDYFRAKSWYQERSDFSESWLSQTERDNAEFIASVEQGAAKSLDDVTAQVLRNIEYTGDSAAFGGGAVLTFTSRHDLVWSGREVDFGPYGVSGYDKETMAWAVMGDWVLVYRDNGDYEVIAYKLDHAAKKIIGTAVMGRVNREIMDKLLIAQGRPLG